MVQIDTANNATADDLSLEESLKGLRCRLPLLALSGLYL